MVITPKSVFRLDGLGAMGSFLFHIVLAFNETIFGMPKNVLLCIAIMPALLMCFSLFHYYNFPLNWKPPLKVVIIANLIFCILSIGLVGYFVQDLTTLGLIYFIGEIIVVLLLVVLVELKTLKKGDRV